MTISALGWVRVPAAGVYINIMWLVNENIYSTTCILSVSHKNNNKLINDQLKLIHKGITVLYVLIRNDVAFYFDVISINFHPLCILEAMQY